MALRRSLIASWVFLAASLLGSRAAIAKVCSGELHPGGNGEDLEVKGKCTVRTSGTYTYGNVNVYGKSASLIFEEPKDTEKKDRRIDFWAKAILVENDGSLEAGTTSHPFGASDGVLTIHLYGKPTDEGIACKTPGGTCGVPDVQWTSNPTSKVGLPGDVNDYFYKYEPLPYGSGFFGNKVLAVSYGGSLRLYGKKGATSQNLHPSDTGRSWVRLAKSVKKGEKTLVVDVKHLDAGNGDLDWQKGDQIVVTTTDYLPGHSEELELASDPTRKGDTVILDLVTAVAYPHHGERFKLTDPDPKKSRIDPRVGIDIDAAETRAAVALLTRSIRIVSGDETAVDFPAPAPGKHYGGHTIIRQGFETVQIQGVEFRRLGQGGRRAHYPIHFYRARQVPNGRKTVGGPLAHEKATVVRDCSVNESMNRWVVLNATQGVVLGRNVGWKSIGHGFYMEEGTETDNKFQSNIGIYARPAVKNATVNPREVPGILSAPVIDAAGENVPFYSDVDHPYVFFIMNGWNEFEYNMAAGAGTCGGCYWLVPGANSGASRFMKWEGYAAMQQPLKPPTSNGVERAALTPLHVFRGNYCTSAMNSFNTIGETSPCLGINGPADDAHLDAVPNPLAPASCDITNPAPPKDARACSKPAFKEADDYYPKVDKGGGRFATRCDDPLKCSTATRCADAGGDANRGKPGDPEKNCMVTILDRYTSSFHWTETNFGAIWLRPQWYLYTNSVLTDVQNGGLSLVTGGGYTRSDTINGHWALARKSVFIGSTQTEEENPYTSNAGPFNKKTYELDGFKCDNSIAKINYCLSKDQGISIPLSAFGLSQRLFSIYDGPAYQESNAYLDITRKFIDGCQLSPPDAPNGPALCGQPFWGLGRVQGMPCLNPEDESPTADHRCYLPNAGIGWKQPNGFYYPPAFHSRNLFYDNVDIRHFVVEPQFASGTFKTSIPKTRQRYATWTTALFDNFTDVDRQTELNDDDGTLTGYTETISINYDDFFKTPVQGDECAAEETARTSPFDYVSTIIFPGCASNCNDTTDCAKTNCGLVTCVEDPNADPPVVTWENDCTHQNCYGVPLYRQYVTKDEKAKGLNPSIRMMGQNVGQRSTLTVNRGKYYVDTTPRRAQQIAQTGINAVNEFRAGQTYYMFLLFAKETTRQTYQFYVGKSFDASTLKMVRAGIDKKPSQFCRKADWPWAPPVLENGILTVTLDMSASPGFQKTFESEIEAAREDHCRPLTFCGWSVNRGCECAAKQDDPFFFECQSQDRGGRDACDWAVKDVDCPKGGCYGIAFTLPSDFCTGSDADCTATKRPAPECFPKNPDWLEPGFAAAPVEKAGQQCLNAEIDPPDFCGN